MKKIEVRQNGSRRVRSVFSSECKTQQHFAENADINNVMSRYRRTGVLSTSDGLVRPTRKAIFGDFSDGLDYKERLDSVKLAIDEFTRLPAKVRAEFDNDPAKMLDFLADESNRERAVELGLVDKAVELPPEDDEGQNSDEPVVDGSDGSDGG